MCAGQNRKRGVSELVWSFLSLSRLGAVRCRDGATAQLGRGEANSQVPAMVSSLAPRYTLWETAGGGEQSHTYPQSSCSACQAPIPGSLCMRPRKPRATGGPGRRSSRTCRLRSEGRRGVASAPARHVSLSAAGGVWRRRWAPTGFEGWRRLRTMASRRGLASVVSLIWA